MKSREKISMIFGCFLPQALDHASIDFPSHRNIYFSSNERNLYSFSTISQVNSHYGFEFTIQYELSLFKLISEIEKKKWSKNSGTHSHQNTKFNISLLNFAPCPTFNTYFFRRGTTGEGDTNYYGKKIYFFLPINSKYELKNKTPLKFISI